MLSRYRILGRLGAGGMGVVCRAEDVSLRRPVALKFLSGPALSQEQTRARFLREARTAAALNHPAICTIYEVGEVEKGEEQALGAGERLEVGAPFIAMELVEGETLEAVLRRTGSLRFDNLLEVALQIADAMAAAHARGIVHRDLKPGNVMETEDGRVKILDFGLAKPTGLVRPDDADATAAETASAELTREGRVLGTAAYMSPEQAKGEPVDSRSDVFSFGVMLYELATGTRPFRGTTTLSTLAKIIEAAPEPIPKSRADIPQEFQRIIGRCLQKKPEDRYNDTRDLVAAIRALRRETSSGAPGMASGAALSTPAARPSLRRRRLWTAAVAGLLVVAVASAFLVRTKGGHRPTAAPPTYRQITYTGTVPNAVVSPDGQFIAYVEAAGADRTKLMVLDLAGGRPLEILSSASIGIPKWTPDGTEVLANATGDDGVRTGCLVPRLGGAPRRLPAFLFVAWSPDGVRLAGSELAGRSITITDRPTGDQTGIAIDAPFDWFLGLDWSPTGALFAITTLSEADNRSTIWTLPAAGGRPQQIAAGDVLFSPRFSPRGDALYYLSGRSGRATSSLWKAAIDPQSGRPSGAPTMLLSTLEIPSFPPHFAFFALSRDGKRLSYARNATRSNLWLAEMDAKAGGGVRATQLTSGTSLDVSPRFSPDGRSIAFVRGNNLFVLRPDGSAPEPLTFGDADHFAPAWSPDGREIAFVSQERDTSRVWRISAAGGAARPFKRTVGSGDRAGDLAWSPGERILYQKSANRNFALLDPATEEEAPLLKDESLGRLWRPRYSPDASRVVVYRERSDASGAGISIISVEDSAERRVHDGFAWPLGWSPDGASVYIVASAKVGPAMAFTSPEILRIPARGGPAVEVVKLPFKEVNIADGGNDVAADGRRFVFSVPDTRSDAWLIENFDPEAE